MNFLIDTNVCSAYLKGHRAVFNRFVQHSGGVAVPTIVVAELYTWAYRAKTANFIRRGLAGLLSDVRLLPLDHAIARRYGELRAAMLDRGRPTPEIDLFIASTALVHGLTLVTHNIKDFAHLPELVIQDWLAA